MTTLSIKNDASTEVAQLLIDQVGTDEVATSKITLGAAGVDDGFVSDANPMPVDDAGGSLTVDNAALSVVGGGVEATALRVTLASDSTGVLSVDDNGSSLTVDNSGTFAVQESGAALTALQLIDDAVYTDDIPFTAGSNKVMAAGFRYDDTTPDAVQQGDVGYARMSSRRELYATIRDAAGNERGLNVDANGAIAVTDGGGAITVDGTVAVSGTVTVDGSGATQPISAASLPLPTGAATLAEQQSQTTALQLIDDAVYTDATGTPSKGIAVMGSDGTNPQLIAVDSSGNVQVDLVSANVTNAGTFAVQAASAGDVAHDSADGGNPVKVGAKAESALSGVTLVADGDRTDLHAGVDGVLITRPHCNLEDIVSGNASNTDGTSTQCIAAQAAGVKTYLTSIILTNTSASSTYVEIKDGATAKLTIPVPANGGAVCNLPVPLGGTAATAWNFDPGAATTTMYCSMIGFRSKV